MDRLSGRTAWITGGARGQGRAIAAKFASEGADIALTDICGPIDSLTYGLGSKEELEETRALIERAGRRCIAEIVDVRDEAGMAAFAERTVREFGRLDVVVANAGIASKANLWEMDAQVWQDVIDVNLTGVFFTIKAVAPAMMEAKRGNIILTASVQGVEAGFVNGHYTASKHGVVGLGKQAAYELGPYNIRVNTVMPGPVFTPMITHPGLHRETIGDDATHEAIMERMLTHTRNWHALRSRPAASAAAIADAMIWLASDESQHVTGIQLPVDAGHLALPGRNLDVVVDDELGTFDYDAHALSGVADVAE